MTVNWNDVNGGNAAAGAFNDTVTASRVNANGSLTRAGLDHGGRATGLAAGASAAQSATLRLPDGAAGEGTIRFLVTTDSGRSVLEYDAQGNPAYGNNTAAAPDEISTLAPYPDLQVANLVVSPTTGLQSGNTVTFAWDDVNTGTGPVSARLHRPAQAYRVSADGSTTLIAAGYLTGTVGHNTATLRLPDGAAAVGTIRLAVTTDVFHNLPEYDAQGNPAYGNNTATAPDEIATLAPYPDLQVTNLAVAPATGLQSGNNVTITWDDANTGNAAAGHAFADLIDIYRINPDHSQSLVNAALVGGQAGLAAGASAAQSVTLKIPDARGRRGHDALRGHHRRLQQPAGVRRERQPGLRQQHRDRPR